MKLLILDGNSILNRAFYGIKVLTTKEGLYTNGIYGFLTMLQRLRDEVDPNAVAVALTGRSQPSAIKPMTATRPTAAECPLSLPSSCPS